jgi:hypothetical protein
LTWGFAATNLIHKSINDLKNFRSCNQPVRVHPFAEDRGLKIGWIENIRFVGYAGGICDNISLHKMNQAGIIK